MAPRRPRRQGTKGPAEVHRLRLRTFDPGRRGTLRFTLADVSMTVEGMAPMISAAVRPLNGDKVGDIELTDYTELCAQLRQVARGVDAMWREALATGTAGSLVIRLGSASHSV